MSDYTTRKQSDVKWAKASKILATPTDSTHTVCRIPKNTLVTNVIVSKTTAYTAGESVVTVGFIGNNETADTDAFMSSAIFDPLSLGAACIAQGSVLNSGGKYFTRAGSVTVTSDSGAGTAGTFQVFVEYVQLKN